MQVNVKYHAQLHGKKKIICLLHGKTPCQTFLFPCTPLHHMWGLEEGPRTSATDFKTPNNSTAGVLSPAIAADSRDCSWHRPPAQAELRKAQQLDVSIHPQLHLHWQMNKDRKHMETLTFQVVQQWPSPQDFSMLLSLNSSFPVQSVFQRMKLLKKIASSLSDHGLETTRFNCT